MSKTDSDSSSSSTSTSSSASSNQQCSNSDEENHKKSVAEKKKLRIKKKTKKYKEGKELIAKEHPINVGNKKSVESKTSKKSEHSGVKVYEKKGYSSSESSSHSDSYSSSSSSENGKTSTDSSSSDSEMEKKPKTERVKVGVSNKPLAPDAEKEKDDASKRVDNSVQEAQEEKKEDKITISENKSEIVGENDEKEKLLNKMDNEEQEVKSTKEKENGEINKAEDDFSSEKKNSNDAEYHYTNGSMVDECRQNSIHHSKSRSHSLSSSHELAKGRSKTPQQKKSRRSPRSRSREHQRKKRTRSRSRARARSGSLTANKHRSDRRDERRRSNSVEYETRRSRRSISLERRKEQRKKRHAERDEHEKAKRAKRDEENLENQQKELNNPEGDTDKIKELDNMTVTDPKAKITERQRKAVDLLTSRTGGAYIPPAKLRLMQAEITDKTSAAYQRIAWEALKKSIHGYINKVNVDNIAIITRELLKENIVRGRGLLCRSIIQAQAASPTFTHVYAALVAIINSKFPNIGELLLKRLVIQFKRAFRRNDKPVCLSSSRFIAHLVNQRVAHEILALEILTLLVESPTDDSVEVAIAFLKECGMKLTEVSSKGIGAIFEMLKNILHEGKLDKRVQYMIEVVFQVRKDGFKDHQSVIEPLELVEEDDQFTHLLMLDDATNTEDMLNAFKFDEEYAANEEKYKGLSKEILGSDASDSAGSSSSSGDESDSDSTDSDNNEKGEGKPTADEIIDNTETNLIALRRTIYLTINSSLDYEECAHKLMKMQLKPGQEIELCHMFLDCCAEQRTYEKFYGLLAQRFCSINKIYIEPFEEIFKDTYQTTHRLDTNRLRNVSKFFAHLLFTDAISWDVLECIKLNEDDTTSSSRIFIKILFQELAEYMGLSQLNKKLKDEVLVESLAGLFPKDNPRNTRFSINFFTSIGLGGLTDELRQFLKNAPKSVPAINAEILANKPINVESSTSTSSSSSSSSSSSQTSNSSSSNSTSVSSTSSSSSSSDTESDSEVDEKKSRRKKLKKTQKSTSSKKVNKRKLEKKKSKKKRKKSKNSKKHHSSSSETDSKTDTETSSTTESSGGSSNKDNDDKRKSKKKYSAKRTEKKYKTSKKKTKTSDNSNEEFSYKQNKKRQNEERLESNKDRQGHEYNENRRSSNDYRSQGTKRAEPQRRDSEVERRREKREQRHSEREREDRKLSRSRSKTRDRRNNHLTREDRDRRNRDYKRDRDSVRRRERKRYEDRNSRSRSRDLDNYAKRDRGYDRSKARNTSKERG